MQKPRIMLVVLLTLSVLVGCASVRQTEPKIGIYLHLLVGHDLGRHSSSVEILEIQKEGEREITYNPVPNNGFLWLRPGRYIVKLKCNSRPGERAYLIPNPITASLGTDASATFDIEDDFFALDCMVTDTGQIAVTSGKVVMLD